MDVSAATIPGRRWALKRSVTLLHVFLLASAAILLAGGIVLSVVLTSTLRSQAIASQRTSLTRYVDGVLRPALVHGGTVVVGRANTNVLLRSLQYEPDIVTVKVWRPDGVLAWTNRERGRIGHKFELDDELEEALDENQTVGTISPANADEAAVERSLGFSRLLQVYAPIRSADGTRAVGAYEIYADPAAVDNLIASR